MTATAPVAILHAEVRDRDGRVLDDADGDDMPCEFDDEGAFVSGTLFSGANAEESEFEWRGAGGSAP